MAGISPWAAEVDQFEVWVVIRVYPIRVAGNSGPLTGETTWEALGLPEEYTTVTKKVRRVGTFDPILVRRAIAENGGHSRVHVALMMLDQAHHEVEGAMIETEMSLSALESIKIIEHSIGHRIELVGTSPTTIVDRRNDVG
jgi:adenylosuccinate synthase